MRRLPAAASVALLGASSVAEAHLVTTGLGPVYDGISHLFVSFDDLLPVVAMALLAGLNGAAAGRRTLFVLPAAWLLGGFLGFTLRAPLAPAGATAASLLVLGILLALDRTLPGLAVAALAAALGLVHGFWNGASLAAAGREASGLLGIAAAVFVLVALLAALAAALERPAARIAVRVAGSWIAAIGLLALGWSLRGRA